MNQEMIMKRAMWLTSALLTLGFVGCDRSSSSSPAMSANEPTSTYATTPPAGTCPFAAKPEAIESKDTTNGAALVFRTADPNQKAELRQELADGEQQTVGAIPSATAARTEEIEQGVQLVFTTDGDATRVRDEVRQRAEELNGRCTTRATGEEKAQPPSTPPETEPKTEDQNPSSPPPDL